MGQTPSAYPGGYGGGYDVDGKRRRAQNAFRTFDTNRDGTLDPREFADVLRSLGVVMSYQVCFVIEFEFLCGVLV